MQKDGEQTSLPLYTEAVKFFNHRDGMVRAAVRTLTLQPYALEDEGIQKFLVSQPASNFLNEVAIIIAEKCQVRRGVGGLGGGGLHKGVSRSRGKRGQRSQPETPGLSFLALPERLRCPV